MSEDKHVRVQPSDLYGERLDTGFYSRDYFVARSKLQDSGLVVRTVGSFGEPWSFGAYALTSQIEWTDSANGVPFFKAESLGSPLVEEGGLSFVTEATHRKLPKSSVGPGDIILNTSGTIGRVAVMPALMAYANSNQDTIKFNPRRPDIDNYFMAAQLCCKFGQVFLNREAGGAVQQHVYLYNFKRIPLAVPSIGVQRDIGAKVRQAEVLREWARGLTSAVLDAYAPVAVSLPDGHRRHARVGTDVLRDRLDAEHYPDEVLAAFAAAPEVETAPLEEVAEVFTGGTLSEAEDGPHVRQATVATLDRVFLNDKVRTVVPPSRRRSSLQTHDLAIAAAAHTASYIGKDVTYAVVDRALYPSTEVVVIRPDRARIPATWLWAYLKSPLGYRQIQACVRGISAHAYPDDLNVITVPLPSAEVARTFEAHDLEMVRASAATVCARRLVAAARLLVEALIERKVTEAELIATSQDPAADRALLERLREDGLDGAGDPLFHDLDALAELLVEAKGDA